MFNIISYISKTICSLNTYIFSCVTHFFKGETLTKTSEIIKSTQPTIDNSEKIIQQLQTIQEQLLIMQPKLNFVKNYVNAVYIKKQRPADQKKLSDYLFDLLDRQEVVQKKFDAVLNLLEHGDSAVNIANILTSL